MTTPNAPDSLGFVLSDAARLMRAAFEERISAAGLGVTPGEARALVHASVVDCPRQAVLAERMGIEPMTLCGYLDRLEAQGLVRREPDPTDRRAKIIVLTQAGGRIVEAIRPVTRNLTEEIVARLGEGGGERLRLALIAMREVLQERRNG